MRKRMKKAVTSPPFACSFSCQGGPFRGGSTTPQAPRHLDQGGAIHHRPRMGKQMTGREALPSFSPSSASAKEVRRSVVCRCPRVLNCVEYRSGVLKSVVRAGDKQNLRGEVFGANGWPESRKRATVIDAPLQGICQLAGYFCAGGGCVSGPQPRAMAGLRERADVAACL